MATEKFNNINHPESNASTETSSWIKNTKLALTALAISLGVTTATGQDTSSSDSIKHQTEITEQGEDPTKAILDKYKITDVKSATITQLEGASKELGEILETITDKETRKPYVILKGKINNQITILKSNQEVEKARIAAEESKIAAEKSIAEAKVSTQIVKSLKGEKD